jgi:solute carrier family 26 (sodium-independent sulfate anion transporter), member 11
VHFASLSPNHVLSDSCRLSDVTMASTQSKVGHGLAKALGIKLDYRGDAVTRGESTYSMSTADSYVEDEPRTIDWIRDAIPTRSQWVAYVRSLFPFTNWILRYNVQWAIGDLVAGITVGAVVVPQSMAYAKLAELPPEYGLYSSFMGVLIYWFFATSKDITIGPVAVMSTIVGNIVNKVQEEHPEVSGPTIASALAIIAGAIVCFIGLVRCGWIVNFIPLPAISAFITGSAINIAVGQVPTLMGIKVKGFNTRASTYLVVINTLKYLGHTKLDAAIGLTALLMLYLIRFTFNQLAKRNPSRAKLYFFLNTLRTAFVLCLYIMIAYLVNRNHRDDPKFKLLGKVPRGFKHAKVPEINTEIISYFASELPASVIVLLIEHIAISKSFGRINNYTINPSQELVAIGVTNLLGPFLGAYPATGSFSRTAIKSKAGVRTPFAGVITAIVVLLALYALPAMFFYIPNAALSAVIIHAVLDLPTPPNVLYQFWRVSPLEVLIFLVGVFVTIFSSIENGIYTTISVSAAVLLYRVVRAQGHFVGKVKIHSVIGDHLIEDKFHDQQAADDKDQRNIFLPLDHNDGSNPSIHVESPYPGIFMYRFSEGFNYPNASHYTTYLVDYIFEHTRRTNPDSWPRAGDRPWNNPGPKKGRPEPDRSHLPTLRAIILDFQAVNNVDITSVQDLIDVRNQLDRYASPEPVQWHLANINNKWTKRALASAGFGYPTVPQNEIHRWKPIFNIADIGGEESAAAAAEAEQNRQLARLHRDEELGHAAPSKSEDITHAGHYKDDSSSSNDNDMSKQISDSKAYARVTTKKVAIVQGLNRPFFHIDLTSALQSAIANVEHSDKLRRLDGDQGATEELNDKAE